MSDESGRLRALEIAFAAEQATTTAAIEHLTEAVNNLTQTVQEFRDTLNKGKGAVWLFGLVATGIGGVASWVMTRIFQA